mmetsp:Transcript_27214/g.5023  ORF Transcript_27214/g.5023 Transcript_27214/m.5023 type:complete len:90 (-) Transcript_27214:1446-1715(-)
MRICLVYVFTHKPVVCTEVDEGDDGGITAKGKILRNDLGVYVVTIIDRISMKQEVIIGPPNMHVNLDSGDFEINLPYNEGFPCDDEGRA